MICADCDRQITGYAYRRAPNMLTICESCGISSAFENLQSLSEYLTLAKIAAEIDDNDWNHYIEPLLRHRARLYGESFSGF